MVKGRKTKKKKGGNDRKRKRKKTEVIPVKKKVMKEIGEGEGRSNGRYTECRD